jgi:hypothetical protein
MEIQGEVGPLQPKHLREAVRRLRLRSGIPNGHPRRLRFRIWLLDGNLFILNRCDVIYRVYGTCWWPPWSLYHVEWKKVSNITFQYVISQKFIIIDIQNKIHLVIVLGVLEAGYNWPPWTLCQVSHIPPNDRSCLHITLLAIVGPPASCPWCPYLIQI